MIKNFLAYDVGTSSVKAVLLNSNGLILASATAEYPLYTPQPGWVEQVPTDYWNAICKTTNELIQTSGIDKHSIKAMSFSTQAMGIIPVDKNGNVLYNNISWVDGRAEEYALIAMKRCGGRGVFKAIAGVELTGKDVIPKLLWLKEKQAAVFQNTYKFLDVNGYLKYKCTGKMVAEWSGACSYAFDVKKKDWERLLFRLTKIGLDKLPDLVRSTDLVGCLTEQAATELGLSTTVEVYGGCDDTQAAAVGTTAIGEGEAHIYVGTSAWVGVSTKNALKFKNGAFCLQSADPAKNIVVCITESAGINTQWLLDNFYKQEKENTAVSVFDILENDMRSVPAGSDYLIVTPWFLGERCPVSTTTTRSTIFNLTHQHTRAHITRAHFEGIAYNLRWSMQNLERDFGFKIETLKITGGGSVNKVWMQLLADITQRKISTTSQPLNAGAFGAAMCAMVGSKTFSSFAAINELIQIEQTFEPIKENFAIYDELFVAYQDIFHQLNKTYQTINKSRFQ